MTSVPLAAMGRAVAVGRGTTDHNPNGEQIEDYRRDRHGIPINAIPVSQPHLAPANALQYAQFRVPATGVTGDPSVAPLLYRVVPPGHENDGSLQTFPGSQLFGQSNTPTTTSSPNNHEGMADRFPFQYAATAGATSNDSNGQRTLVRPGGQFATAVAAAPANGKVADAAAASAARSSRDERRRATHNEVERRRRDKINNWIVTLSKIVPDCLVETSNAKGSSLTQTLNAQSKGGILAKTVEYITELKLINGRLGEQLKEAESNNMDVEMLRQQMEELKTENSMLRGTLAQNGINLESS